MERSKLNMFFLITSIYLFASAVLVLPFYPMIFDLTKSQIIILKKLIFFLILFSLIFGGLSYLTKKKKEEWNTKKHYRIL